MNYEYPHRPTFSRNEPIGCLDDFVRPTLPDDFIKQFRSALRNTYSPNRCIINKRIKLNSLQMSYNNQQKNQSPKQRFMGWCWKNGREIAEMVSDIDRDIFDQLWPDIAGIFNLTDDGECATCKKDCDTCAYGDMLPKDGSPCWECCDGKSQYIRRAI